MEARSLLQREASTILLRIGTELYGPPHRVVCGGSIIRAGSILELIGMLPPDPLGRLEWMRRGYFGH
jgi:hypothetical protein